VLYNVSMLVLTIVGVVGIAVYSYKMSRTPVYPVGIVRKPRVTRPVALPLADKAPSVVIPPKQEITPDFVNSQWAALDNYLVRASAEKPGVDATGKFGTYQVKHHALENAKYVFFDDADDVLLTTGSVWNQYDLSSWSCPRCGLLQKYEKEARCAQCSYVPDRLANVTVSLESTKASALQTQVSQHDQTLQDLDKRIRELEKESVVKKIAEVARKEEKRQDWVQ
jgi:hypothetical protein